jgi:hypothetical protein
MSEQAHTIGPTPGPLLLRPVDLDVVDRVERLSPQVAGHPFEDGGAAIDRVHPGPHFGGLAREKSHEHPGPARRRGVVVELTDQLIRAEALAGEPVASPERLVVDGEDLDDRAL